MSKLQKTILTTLLLQTILTSHPAPQTNETAQKPLDYPEKINYNIVWATANSEPLQMPEDPKMSLEKKTKRKPGRPEIDYLQANLNICGNLKLNFSEEETLLNKFGGNVRNNCTQELRADNMEAGISHDVVRSNFVHVDSERRMIRLSFFGADWVVMNIENPVLQNDVMVIGRYQA